MGWPEVSPGTASPAYPARQPQPTCPVIAQQVLTEDLRVTMGGNRLGGERGAQSPLPRPAQKEGGASCPVPSRTWPLAPRTWRQTLRAQCVGA